MAEGTSPRENVTGERRAADAEVRGQFTRHLFAYPLLIGICWLINYLTTDDPAAVNWWAIWPTIVLGASLLLEVAGVYTGLMTSIFLAWRNRRRDS